MNFLMSLSTTWQIVMSLLILGGMLLYAWYFIGKTGKSYTCYTKPEILDFNCIIYVWSMILVISSIVLTVTLSSVEYFITSGICVIMMFILLKQVFHTFNNCSKNSFNLPEQEGIFKIRDILPYLSYSVTMIILLHGIDLICIISNKPA